jgi:hypothetical protein
MAAILQVSRAGYGVLSRGAALRVSHMHAANLLTVTLTLVAWSVIVTQRLNPGTLVFALLYPLAAYYAGRLVLAPVRVEGQLGRSFALHFLTGYLALGLVQYALRAALPGPLAVQFALLFVAAAAGQFLLPASGDEGNESAADALAGLFVTAFCLAAATCWARGLFHAVQPDGDQIVFHHWSDLFTHANVVARFTGSDSLIALGHFEVSGQSASLYHFSSYLGPATAAVLGKQSAYEVVQWYWTPTATFLTGLAAYALVLPWAGRTGGLCAVAALLVLPDASYVWPANGMMGYHWLQQIASGGAYGTACCAVALTFLMQWRRLGSVSALVAGLGFTVAVIWYKAQLFVVLAPLVVACLVLWQPGVSSRRRGLRFAALAVTGLVVLLMARRLPAVEALILDHDSFEKWNTGVMAPSSTDEGMRAFFAAAPDGGRLGTTRYYARMIGACAVCTLGAWLGLGALLQLARLPRPRAEDVLPWGALALFLVLYASLDSLALTGHNSGELTHRPLVLVYFLLSTWCAARCGQMLAAAPEARLAPFAVAAVAVLLLVLPYRMGRSVQAGKCPWRRAYFDLSQPRGLVECGRYVAAHGSGRDVIEDAGYDPLLVAGGFAERRSYLARPAEWQRDNSPNLRAEAERRLAVVESLKQCTDADSLRRTAVETGIRWFILGPSDAVRWPAAVQQAPAFAAHGYRVYDLIGPR